MEELVARLKTGDNEAFEKFVSQYEKNIYNLALHILNEPHDAEDAVQEAFLRVFYGIHRFRGDSALSTWVYQITVNVCLDMIRRKKRHPEESLMRQNDEDGEIQLDIPDVSTDYQPELHYERRETQEFVRQAIQQLPSGQRSVIVLREIIGLNYDEIARALRISEGTVKSRLHRGRENLWKLFHLIGNKNAAEASNRTEER